VKITKLNAYVVDGHRVDIRPAPLEREWMEARLFLRLSISSNARRAASYRQPCCSRR
jgi:hypothetical protein